MSLDIQAWVLGRGGAPDVALPDLGNYTLTPIFSGVGAISLDYPRDGRNFDALRRVVDEDRPIEIEARVDGTSATALRFLLLTAAGDAIKPGAVWTFTGQDLGSLLGDWRLPYNTTLAQGGNDRGETSLSGTAGVILRTLLQRAQAAGYLLDITFATFSNTLDTSSAAWAKTAVITLSPGTSLLSVLDVLVTAGLCEWEVTAGRVLRVHNSGGRGVDRSLPGAGQRTLEHGRDLIDAPVRHDVTKAITNFVASGKDGLYAAAANATALARIGWRRAGYGSFGSIGDQGSLDAAAQLTASISGDGLDEQTHALVLESGSVVVPGRDVQLGDWVLRGVNGFVTRKRIVSYQIARKGAEISANIVVGSLIESRAKRVQAQIDGLSGGSIVVGTSTRPPDVDDGKSPAAPAGVSASSSAYYDGGTPLAQVTAAWTAVTTNADGTAIGDLDHYEVQYRYQTGQNLPTAWQLAGSPTGTTTTFSPIVANRALDVQVFAVDKYGHRSAASPTASITTGADATPPPVLPAPIGSAYLGILKWDWIGTGSAGETMPPDFLEAELHLSLTSGFTPDRPVLADGRTLNTAASTTYRDRLTGAGEMPVDPGGGYGVTWYGKWVAVDKSRNASSASAQGSAVRTQAADGDIAALNVGKLVTGIMSALLTISGIIRTASTGARVELDTTGLRCISSTGAVLFEFNIPGSVLTLIGKVVTGVGVGVGRTIVIDPTGDGANPAILLYPNGTTQRVRIRALNDVVPGGGAAAPTLVAELLTSAGAAAGGVIQLWDDGAAIFQRTGSTTGGQVILKPALAFMGAPNNRYISISDTDVTIVPALGSNGGGFSFKIQGLSNTYRTVFDSGSNVIRFADNGTNTYVGDGAGGLKTFVIDHPTDPDRWLVHGCTEAPEAAVEYRGVAEIVDGAAVVTLPDYFEAATRPDGRTVHVTMMLPDDPLDTALPAPPLPADRVFLRRPAPPQIIPERALLHPVAASAPRDGRFRIASPAPDGTRVAWLVKAVRADVAELDAEPLRADVHVAGDGPYRYIREAA